MCAHKSIGSGEQMCSVNIDLRFSLRLQFPENMWEQELRFIDLWISGATHSMPNFIYCGWDRAARYGSLFGAARLQHKRLRLASRIMYNQTIKQYNKTGLKTVLKWVDRFSVFEVVKVVAHPNKLSLVVKKKKTTPLHGIIIKTKKCVYPLKKRHITKCRWEGLSTLRGGGKKNPSYCVNNFPLALTSAVNLHLQCLI